MSQPHDRGPRPDPGPAAAPALVRPYVRHPAPPPPGGPADHPAPVPTGPLRTDEPTARLYVVAPPRTPEPPSRRERAAARRSRPGGRGLSGYALAGAAGCAAVLVGLVLALRPDGDPRPDPLVVPTAPAPPVPTAPAPEPTRSSAVQGSPRPDRSGRLPVPSGSPADAVSPSPAGLSAATASPSGSGTSGGVPATGDAAASPAAVPSAIGPVPAGSGAGAVAAGGGGADVSAGATLRFRLDFGEQGLSRLATRLRYESADGSSALVTVRLGAPSAPPIGSFSVGDTGAAGWQIVPADITTTRDVQDVYLTFGSGARFVVDSLAFS
ncbi:carbohydrate-binding protein [Streptomyces sp. NPDC046887]|uniref:carbohydrate-binding protein n=1 Tax=Streptomyces sp. NPDC046887 TaxID=3155472 RepID=UPI0033D33F11